MCEKRNHDRNGLRDARSCGARPVGARSRPRPRSFDAERRRPPDAQPSADRTSPRTLLAAARTGRRPRRRAERECGPRHRLRRHAQRCEDRAGHNTGSGRCPRCHSVGRCAWPHRLDSHDPGYGRTRRREHQHEGFRPERLLRRRATEWRWHGNRSERRWLRAHQQPRDRRCLVDPRHVRRSQGPHGRGHRSGPGERRRTRQGRWRERPCHRNARIVERPPRRRSGRGHRQRASPAGRSHRHDRDRVGPRANHSG